MRGIIAGIFLVCAGVLFVPQSAQAVTIDMVTGRQPRQRAGYALRRRPASARSATSTRSASTKSRPASTPSSSTPWPRPTPTGCTTRRWAIPVIRCGANIQRTGSSPNYSYSVAADWANRPVNYVSFWDAARFANWLHNGQPTGAQGPGTTEGGAYHDVGNQTLFGRNAGAKFFIPTEDEWYKAAYHDKTAGLAASYFDYPTGTNAVPGNDINEATNPGNNANYYISGLCDWQPVLSHGRRRIRVVRQSLRHVRSRRQRVGVERNGCDQFVAWYAWRVVRRRLEHPARVQPPDIIPTNVNGDVGFRVASIPEPATAVLAILAGALGWALRKRFK